MIVDSNSPDIMKVDAVSPTTTFKAIIHPTETPLWQVVSRKAQDARNACVSEWARETMGVSTPRVPPSDRKDVRNWPVESGHLTQRQTEITGTVPTLILRKLAAGVWTAEEVLKAFTIRAVVAHHLTNPLADVFFEQGLARARQLDNHLAQTGKVVGPLHGLPISLKDCMNLERHATTLGFVALVENKPASSDKLVSRLHDAGAVFYCKTTVPQSLMSGECSSLLFGTTSTPDNRTLSAGGSSGGEGSLIALRGSPLGIGTDIAGSIRTPANFNGVYGLCPTYGRFPCHSLNPEAVSLINGVAGPLSTSLDGLELYARTVLSMEPWTWDPVCVPMPWNERAYQQTTMRGAVGELAFGFVATDGVVRPHPPIERGMREMRDALVRAGHQVIDCSLFANDDHLWDLAVHIFCADGGKALSQTLDLLPEPPVPEIFVPPAEMALSVSELASKSKTLFKVRQAILERWQKTSAGTKTGRPVDVFIMPSGGHVAPPLGTMEYWLYEAISNIIDWPCATIPCGNVNAELDPVPDTPFEPMSDEDEKNWKKCECCGTLVMKLDTDTYQDTPEAYENGAICLQVMAPRFQEEQLLSCLSVINQALGRDSQYMT